MDLVFRSVRGPGRIALLVLAWAAATVTLTFFTWQAVDMVGARVSGLEESKSAAAVQQELEAATSGASSSPTAAAPTGTRAPSASQPAGGAVTPTAEARTGSGSATSAGSSRRRSDDSTRATTSRSTPRSSATSSSRRTTNPPVVRRVSRVFSVRGGTLSVTCRSASASLNYAAPSSGWSLSVGSRGTEHVDVEFRSGDSETKARVVCSGGTPQISSETKGGGGSGGHGADD